MLVRGLQVGENFVSKKNIVDVILAVYRIRAKNGSAAVCLEVQDP